MESIGILRVLWGRRVAVAVGACLALAAGVLTGFQVSPAPPAIHARGSTSGVALARVLVDTPRSLVADARAPGAGTVYARSILLGALMARDPVRSAVARKAGVRPEELGMIGPTTVAPLVATPLADEAVEATQPHLPYLVTVTADSQLPILSIATTAPTPGQAAQVSDAAIAALSSVARNSPIGEGAVRIVPLAKPEVATRSAPSALPRAAIATLGVFGLFCLAILVGHGITSRRVAGSSTHREAAT
jgi:hypothetical protein